MDTKVTGTEAQRHKGTELKALKKLQMLSFVFPLCLCAFVTLCLFLKNFLLLLEKAGTVLRDNCPKRV